MKELLDILILDSYKLVGFLLEYIVIFMAICADLVVGIRKAKREGKLRTSFGFRKTLDKVIQYYSAVFFLSFVDILQMYLVGGLMRDLGWTLFSFPIITFIATFYICIIEYRSIREKRDVKVNARIDEITTLLSSILKDKGNFEVVDSVIDTLRKVKDIKKG